MKQRWEVHFQGAQVVCWECAEEKQYDGDHGGGKQLPMVRNRASVWEGVETDCGNLTSAVWQAETWPTYLGPGPNSSVRLSVSFFGSGGCSFNWWFCIPISDEGLASQRTKILVQPLLKRSLKRPSLISVSNIPYDLVIKLRSVLG